MNLWNISPTLFKVEDPKKAIFCCHEAGPIFGNYDLFIKSNALSRNDNSISFPKSYSDMGKYNKSMFFCPRNEKIDASQISFQVLDYEVYSVRST